MQKYDIKTTRQTQ